MQQNRISLSHYSNKEREVPGTLLTRDILMIFNSLQISYLVVKRKCSVFTYNTVASDSSITLSSEEKVNLSRV